MASLGGPILHDRLFFFGDFQGVRQLIGVTRISTIPTLNERKGIFTGVSKIYNPATTQVVNGVNVRKEFPNDVISTPFDPATVALLARFPTPTNLTAAANNYTRTSNDADHQAQFDLRIDGALRGRDRAFGRYSYYNEVEQPVAPLPDGSGVLSGAVIGTGGVAGLSNVLGQQAVFDETHTFSAHLVNDFRVGYTRRGNTIAGATLGNTASSALGIPGIPTNAAFSNALPLFTFTGFQQLGPSASTFSQYQTAVWQAVDTVVFTRGRHTVKAGADLRWYQLNAVAPPNPTGSFAFTTTGTNQQGVTNSGNAIASFLLGQVDTFQIDLQENRIRPRDHIEEYFVQDDWKATDRLTANIGARWTLHFPSTEKNNQGAVFNLASQQLDYLGINGISRNARELHADNVAPRVGFAYLVTPKTVVRAGFGIVFIDQSGITTPFTTPQFPFIQNVQQKTQDSVNAAFALSAGPTVAPIPFTPDAGLGQSVYTANRSAGSGYVEQWNLAVQRELTRNLSFEVAYIGSHIVHVGIPDSNLNQLTAAQLAEGAPLLAKVPNPYYGQLPISSSIGGKTTTAAQLLKPYPRFLNVATYRNNSGKTNYNAGEVKVEQRLDHGLAFLFAYTHSRLIDDASSVFSTTVLSSPNSSSLIAADSFRPWLERDVSSGDMPNVTSLQRHLRSTGRLRTLLRVFRPRWRVTWRMAAQHDLLRAIGHAYDHHSVHQQQFVRRIRAAAAQPCRQAQLVAQPAHPGALHQHRSLCYCTAIHHRHCFAQSRARARLSRCRLRAREAHKNCWRSRDGISRRVVRRLQHARVRTTQRQLRLSRLRQHHQYRHRSARPSTRDPLQSIMLTRLGYRIDPRAAGSSDSRLPGRGSGRWARGAA